MSPPAPQPDVIRATFRWLAHRPHGVSEVRVIRPSRGVLGIGFFDDEDAFVAACVARNAAAANVYVGIQPRPRRFLALAPNTVRALKAGATNDDIAVLTATVIDIDPIRPKDTASTDAELAEALAAAEEVRTWCASEGLVSPRLMMSGNGAQLWCALPPTTLDDTRRVRLQAGLKSFEATLRDRVARPTVHVDSVHDLARIIKVIGTVSYKGAGGGDRPHRVSAPRADQDREEDPVLLSRLEAPPEAPLLAPLDAAPPRARTHLPVAASASPWAHTKARRTADGDYDWAHPVAMCSPIARLWNEGHKDRSLAIFNMVRFFAHLGLGLQEITELVVEYDRRGLGKLTGRDGPSYIRAAYDKIVATARDDGTIAPPCHALQKLTYCAVNRDPGARCDLEGGAPKEVPAGTLAPKREHPSRPAPARPRPAEEKAVLEIVEGEIYEAGRRYACRTPRGDVRILSSFTIALSARIVTDEGELLVGDAHTHRGVVVPGLRLPLSAFHSRRDFMRFLPSADLQWTGSDNQVQGLLRLLAAQSVPRRLGIARLGHHEHEGQHLWIAPEGVLGARGPLASPPVTYFARGSSLDRSVSYPSTDDETFRALAHAVFRCLPKLAAPEIMLPMMGRCFATPMKPHFMRAVGSFPLLLIAGEAPDGVNLHADILGPLLGVHSAPHSVAETELTLRKLLSETTSVPVFLEDYKPFGTGRHRIDALHRILRRVYRGEADEHSRAAPKATRFDLQAPTCIAGEAMPTDAALLERMLIVRRACAKRAEGSRHACDTLRALDLTRFAERYIAFCLGRDFAADLEIARSVAATYLDARRVPLRIRDNLTAMLLGVHLFEAFAEANDCTLPDDLGIEEAIDAVLDAVLEPDDGAQSALDHFLEMLGIMAVQGELQDRIHYAFVDTRLALHLESAYDAFRAHCKRIDYEGELVDLKALRRLAQENRKQGGFVVAESERVTFDAREGRRRALVIDFSKTNDVSAADFPQSEARNRPGYGWNDGA